VLVIEEEEKEGVQGLEGPCRDVVEGRGRLDKQRGVFLQSHGMGIHGASQTLILEALKGLLDSGVHVLDGPFGQVFCPCGHGLHVLDGPFGQVFCPCGHGLHVLDGPFGQVFCPCGHDLHVRDGPSDQAFFPCGHALHVLDGPSDQAFFPCGHALHVLGDGGEYALVDVLDGGGVGGHGIYSLSLTEQGVALDELSSELRKFHIPLLVPHFRP
jgi:hypothetical protein